MKKGFLLSLLCCLSCLPAFATNYYYQGGTFTTASNWNDNPAGGGGTPVDFTNAADVWIVTTTNALAINSAWTVAGALQIDGTCTITIVNPTITGGITINTGGTLNQSVASTASSPNMAAVHSGTISFGTGTHSIPAGITFQNMAIAAASSTCTATGDITINGTLTIPSSEILDMSTFQLIGGASFATAVAGTINTASSASEPIPSGYAYFSGTTGTVNYNGTGAQTVVGGTYLTLTVSGARGGADITFEPSTTIRIGSGNNTSSLTLSATGVGNYITANTTIAYGKGNGGQTVSSALTYNNLSLLNASGTQTANGNITVNGALSNAAGTFTLSTFQLLGTPTSVTNTGTIATNNTGSNPFPSDLTWGTAGTVSYASAGAQTVVRGTYFNMSITGNKASNPLTFEAGTYNMGGTTFTGTATNISSYVTTGTTFNFTRAAGGATLFALAIPYEDITFGNTSGTYTAGTSLTVNGTLTTTAGGTLSFANAAHQLLLGGGATVNNNGIISTICTTVPAIPVDKDWSGTGATGRVTYANTTTGQTVVQGTYKNLTVGGASGTVTYSAGNDLEVNGTLTTALSTSTLNMGSYALNGTPTTVTNTGTVITQNTSSAPLPTGKSWGGTVRYNLDAGGQTIVSGTYASLYMGGVTGGVTNTAGGALTVNTRLDIATNTILEMGTNALAGTLTTIANAGTLNTQNLSAAPLTTGRNWNGAVFYNAVGGGQTVMAGTYANLTTGAASSSGTNTLSGAISVSTTLTNTANYTLLGTALGASIGGAMTPTNNGTIQLATTVNPAVTANKDWSPGAVILSRTTGGQFIPAGTYQDFTVLNASGTNTVSGTITVNGTLTTTAGGTVIMQTNQLAGTPTIAHFGTITTTNTGATPFTSGLNWGTNGTVTFATTTVGSQTVPAGTYNNLTLAQTSATVNATAAGDITVNGTLTTTTGSSYFDLGTNNLIAGGSFAVANNGSIKTSSSSATPVPSGYSWMGTTGGFEYRGTGAQTIMGGSYQNLTISGARGGADITFEPLATVSIGNGTTTAAALTLTASGVGNYVTTDNTIAYAKSNGAQSILNTFNYNNLSLLNTSGTQTAAGSLTVNGTLTTAAGSGILSFANAAHQLFFGLSATVDNNGTIQTICTTDPAIPVDQDWSGTGATGKVTYANTTTSQTVVQGTYKNLTVGGASGTVTYVAGNDLEVNGTLTTALSTSTLNMSTFALSGSPTSIANVGTITTHNTSGTPLPTGKSWNGIVRYNLDAGGQTVAQGTYASLYMGGITAGVTNTAGGALTVNTRLDVATNTILDMGANTLAGTLTTIANAGTILTQNTSSTPLTVAKSWNGTVKYNLDAGGQTISQGTYASLYTGGITGGVTNTAGGALSVSTRLDVASGTILDMGTNALSGTLTTIANAGTVSTQNVSATPLTTGRNWNGAVVYNAVGGGQTVMAGTYADLTTGAASSTGTNTLSGAISVSSTLTNTADYTLSAAAVGHSISGAMTPTNNGTIQTICTVNPAIPAGKDWTPGTVIFTRTTGGQSIPGGTYQNFTVLNTSATNSVVGTPITVNGILTTTAGGTLAMQTNALGGTPTMQHFGTITTTNTGATPLPSDLDWTNGGGTGTVSFGGTTTATIVTGTYHNLTTTGAHGANTITLASGDITVNNNLSWAATTSSYANTGNTLTLNNLTGGVAAINTGALTVNNLTLNNTSGSYTAGAALTVNGTLTSTAGGMLDMSTQTLSMGGSSSTSGTGTIKTSNTSATPVTASKTWTQTVEFGSASNQSIVAGTYANLVLSSAGTKSVTGTVNVTGDLTLGASNTLYDGVNTVTVSGNILGTGTHTGTTGKIVMNGASATISGATLRNLQLNNAAGFSLSGNPTINGTLTFTDGLLDLGNNNLTFGTTGAAATPSSSSMIVASGSGEVRRNYTANGSFTFPIGDNAGPNYTPIAVSFTGGTYGGGAYAAAKVTNTVHPQNYSGSDYLNRYWTINTSNITSPVYTVTATYVPGDVVGSEAQMYMGEYSSSDWTQHSVANTGAHTISTNANVTATSADFTGVGGPAVSVNTATICPTGTATLTASATTPFTPVTYTWAPNTNLSATTGISVEATPTVTTVYTVTAMDSHGLTGIGTTTVTVVSQPSVNIGLSASGYICPTTVMTLTATPSGGTGTADYVWSGPGISGTPSSGAVASFTAIPSPSYTLIPTNAAGSYSVVLTYSGSGCQSVAATSGSITPAVHQWEGGASGDVNNWSNASNWVCGGVPAASDHILIPVRSNQPTILASTTSSIARLYAVSGTTLTMGATSTLNVSGNFTNAGTITGPTTAKVVLNGSSLQTINGGGNIFNLELNNSAGAVVSVDTLTIKGTLSLTSGTITTNGRLMLYADNTTNGRIGEITGGAISGNIVTQMWFQTVGHKAWHFFSHPFDNYIAMTMLCNSINMTGQGGVTNGWSDAASNEPSSYYINASSGWAPFTNAYANTPANQFKQHQGIRLFVWGNLGEGIWGGSTSTSVRMRLYGHPNTGTQNVVMNKATTDYNQVGNPYPSPVNIGQVVKDAFDASKLVGSTYWVWDPALGTTGQYVAKNIDGSAFYIASGNAFQLRTATNGNTLIFNESHKGTTPSNSLRLAGDRINLSIYDATFHAWDRLSVKFDQESADAEDNADGGKPESPADLNFYSISSDNVKLSSDVRPYGAGKVIPLGISSNVKSQFILKADNVVMPAGARVYLHDKLLNKYQLLTPGAEYPFAINENGMSQGDNRFELTMEELHAFDIHTNVTLEAAVAPNPAVSEVAVSYTTSGAENTTITVADVSGHILFTKDAGTARNGKVIVPLSQFASGVYLVTVTSGDARIEKTLIKE